MKKFIILLSEKSMVFQKCLNKEGMKYFILYNEIFHPTDGVPKMLQIVFFL